MLFETVMFWCCQVFICIALFFVNNSIAATIYGEDENLHPVFIFGVMKRGEPMHHFLESRNNCVCHFVTEACTMETFPMVIASKYNVPIVIYKPEMGHAIHGELYEMNLPMIKKIERYIYLPHEIIGRIETITYNDSKTNETVNRPAIMFVKYYLEDNNWLELPFISNYHSKGAHGLEFRERPIKKKKVKKKSKHQKHKKKDKNNSEGDVARMKRRMERNYNKTIKKKTSHNISTTTERFKRLSTLSN